MSAPPIAWSIAGSDSGAGAGLQADLRAFDAFDVHGCTAVAAITAQNSLRVDAIEAVSPPMLRAQLDSLVEDLPPASIKTGLLGSAANVHEVVRAIDRLRSSRAVHLVVDPVLRSTTGASFADEAIVRAYRDELLPRATLVTPNRAEAAALLGLPPPRSDADVEQAARALLECGARAVVVTGGDDGGDAASDFVMAPQARGWLHLPRVATPHHHGTGCAFASGAAAALARGFVEIEACVLAKMATAEALRHAYAAGGGAGPVRPRAGFATRIENLPSFPMAGRAAPPLAFKPLTEPRMGLYAIVDSADWVGRVLAAGVRTVQLRIKEQARSGLWEEVRASVEAARSAGAQLFVNDHWELAIEAGAYGVHLGQEDLQLADLHAIAAAGLRLGVSTHSYWEVCRAWAIKPSYVACGPIHPTAAKAMPWIPQGNANLAYWCSLLPIPVVAIAGMDELRAREAVACGASGVAVIRAITGAANPEQAIEVLNRAIGQRVGDLASYHHVALPQSTLSS